MYIYHVYHIYIYHISTNININIHLLPLLIKVSQASQTSPSQPWPSFAHQKNIKKIIIFGDFPILVGGFNHLEKY